MAARAEFDEKVGGGTSRCGDDDTMTDGGGPGSVATAPARAGGSDTRPATTGGEGFDRHAIDPFAGARPLSAAFADALIDGMGGASTNAEDAADENLSLISAPDWGQPGAVKEPSHIRVARKPTTKQRLATHEQHTKMPRGRLSEFATYTNWLANASRLPPPPLGLTTGHGFGLAMLDGGGDGAMAPVSGGEQYGGGGRDDVSAISSLGSPSRSDVAVAGGASFLPAIGRGVTVAGSLELLVPLHSGGDGRRPGR